MKSSVEEDKRSQWQKHDALLCNILQRSIEPKTLDILRDYQTCQPFWTQAKNSISMMFNASTVSSPLLIV